MAYISVLTVKQELNCYTMQNNFRPKTVNLNGKVWYCRKNSTQCSHCIEDRWNRKKLRSLLLSKARV